MGGGSLLLLLELGQLIAGHGLQEIFRMHGHDFSRPISTFSYVRAST